MKIRITDHVPVEAHIRPAVGGVYEVEEIDVRAAAVRVYFIRVNGERVGVLARECEAVREGES